MRAIVEGATSPSKFADLHMHTRRSDGRMRPRQVVDIAEAGGQLQEIAITDHEIIDGSVVAKNYCEKAGYALSVRIGAELTSRDGHIIGIDLNDNIVTGRPLEWTMYQIRKQGGLIIIPHPMYKWTRSLNRDKILSVIYNPDPDIRFDGFEVFNAGVGDNPRTKANIDALAFYLELNAQDPEAGKKLGAPIGSTDGHFYTVGRGLTGYNGDLREAILVRETSVYTLDMQEQIELLELALQMWGSMVLEPTRRIQRYAIRRYREEMERRNGDQ